MTGIVSAIVSKQGLHPRMDHDLPTMFYWMRANELTYNSSVFDRSSKEKAQKTARANSKQPSSLFDE